MKYLHTALLLLTSWLIVSCNDELEEELFHKFSYITHSGWQDYKLEVNDDNTAILPIYFGVNGTSGNEQNIQISIGLDTDTLAAYNKEKYKNQENLYYQLLPEGTYSFDAESYTIPKGDLKAGAYITLDLNKIKEIGSLYNDYVLPLQILSSVGEPMGPSKYTKVLAHIQFENDFSGSYTGKGVVTQKNTSYTTEVTSTELFAINNTTCYMFVGEKTRTNTEDYLHYVIELTKDPVTEQLSVRAGDHTDGLNFVIKSAIIERKYNMNYNDNRYYTEVTTIKIQYEYTDSTNPVDKLEMSFDGSFSMSRDVLRVEYPDVPVEV